MRRGVHQPPSQRQLLRSKVYPEHLKPLSYDLTRTRGRIEFTAQMTMDERLAQISEQPQKQLSFADLQAIPSSENNGNIPSNPMKK